MANNPPKICINSFRKTILGIERFPQLDPRLCVCDSIRVNPRQTTQTPAFDGSAAQSLYNFCDANGMEIQILPFVC